MDLARSIQVVTEEVMLRMARAARSQTNEEDLCLAGGVALNCVGNGVLARAKIFRNIWVQPAAGDAGGALGAALFAWHQAANHPRTCDSSGNAMRGSYLGPEFSDQEIEKFLAANEYPYRGLEAEAWAEEIATLLAQGRVVGLFQGAMEYGPRALGNRSILADARNPKMQSHLTSPPNSANLSGLSPRRSWKSVRPIGSNWMFLRPTCSSWQACVRISVFPLLRMARNCNWNSG